MLQTRESLIKELAEELQTYCGDLGVVADFILERDKHSLKACKELNAAQLSPLSWFTTPNPLLGNVSPVDMIKNGRQDKLCKWILNQIEENAVKGEL